jgi:hypothetical protein
MTWLDALTEKALARRLPTRAEALQVLASEGQPGGRDLEMIADAGFTVEGADERTLPGHRRDLVRVRRRGPGTALPANA